MLPLWEQTTDNLNWNDREHGDIFRIVSMEVGYVVPLTYFEKHPNDDPIKPRQFRHWKVGFTVFFNLPQTLSQRRLPFWLDGQGQLALLFLPPGSQPLAEAIHVEVDHWRRI